MFRIRMLTGLLILVASVAAIWLTNNVGDWWATLIVGGVIGLLWTGAGVKTVIAVLAGGLGWILPLLWQAQSLPMGRASSVLAGMMGFGVGDGWIVWVLTAVFGILLSISATWLGSAIARLVTKPATT
ncbi:MAG: hypothetical protein OWT28_09140 [Firmicutes bacterium]|nr:hypothetical protein [Bacillota bacterium]